MINQINTNKWAGQAGKIQNQNQNQIKQGKQEQIADDQAAVKTDRLVVGAKVEAPVTYSKESAGKKLDSTEISALMDEADKATENLRKLVEQLILKQSKGYEISKGEKPLKESSESQISTGNVMQAEMSISEDGEFGVNAVSDRLVDFAITISGGDKAKFSVLAEGIKQGFEAAKEKLGGQLPDICNKTYDETMRKLEAWANS